MYVILDEDQRVCVTYMSHAPAEAVEIPEPDGWDAAHQHDWQLEGGVLIYRPLPAQEGETETERLKAENVLLRAQVQALSDRGEFVEDCIAEMATKVYGGV